MNYFSVNWWQPRRRNNLDSGRATNDELEHLCCLCAPGSAGSSSLSRTSLAKKFAFARGDACLSMHHESSRSAVRARTTATSLKQSPRPSSHSRPRKTRISTHTKKRSNGSALCFRASIAMPQRKTTAFCTRHNEDSPCLRLYGYK